MHNIGRAAIEGRVFITFEDRCIELQNASHCRDGISDFGEHFHCGGADKSRIISGLPRWW